MHKLYYEALLSHKSLSENDRKWLVANFKLSSNKVRDILLSYKLSRTGKLAVKYNRSLDDIARERNVARLQKLYSLSFEEAIPELKLLDKDERKMLMKRINLEYSAIKNLKINEHKNLPQSYLEAGSTPYGQSFKLLCFHEFNMNYTPSVVPDKINIKDDNIYCLDYDEIVERLNQGNYINPLTNEPFSDDALGLLFQALKVDLKINQA